jgi:HK97 family phage major capsid protein
MNPQGKGKEMKLRELQQALTAATEAAAAIDAAVAAGSLMTDEQRTQFDAHMAKATALKADIARAEQLAEMQRTSSSLVEVSKPEGTKKPWDSLGQQLMAVAKGTKLIETGYTSRADPRLFAALGANETIPSEGGFLVAPEFGDDLLQKTYEVGEIASRCRKMPFNSSRLVMNAVDESSRVDGQRWGGILSYWESEGAPYQGVKPKFTQVQFVANKLIGLGYVTEEQLEDGPALEAYLKYAFPQEFGFQIDKAIFSGSGAGVPLGFQNSPALVAVTPASGETTAVISATDVLNMKSRMWSPSFKSAVWLSEQSAEPQLIPMLLAGTAATTAALMYTPPGMYGNNTPYGLLLGRPVIFVEQAAQLGTQGDINLVDLSQYLLPTRTDIRSDTSIHVAFLTGETAFRFMLRLDGAPWWKKPQTPYSGAPARSPFVTLATGSR